MGITPSIELDMPEWSNINYFALCFAHKDRLQLILASESIIKATEALILVNWDVQHIRRMNGLVEFKIKGAPWSNTDEYNIEVKYFLCQLLQAYYLQGWHQRVTTDIERTGSGKNLVIFEKREPLQTSVMCLSMQDSDKINLLAPQPVINLAEQIIKMNWLDGVKRIRQLGRSYEFQLYGNPIFSKRTENVNAVFLINQMLNGLLMHGWKFSGVIRIGSDVDSLYFISTNQQQQQPSHCMVVSLDFVDRLRFIQPKPEQINQIRQFMHQNWELGIQDEINELPKCYEFKLSGTPWKADGSRTVTGRQLIADLFQFMYNNNYELYSTIEHKGDLTNKSSLFFRSKPLNVYQQPVRPSHVICVSLHEYDKIRVIRGNEHVIDLVRQAITNGWPGGINNENEYYDSWQFKLSGWPFGSNSTDQAYAALLMMNLLTILSTNGYMLITSMDVSRKSGSDTYNRTRSAEHYKTSLHSWYFVKS